MKIIESAKFHHGGETMKIRLQKQEPGWTVLLTVRGDDGKIITSGYTGRGPKEQEVRDNYAWACAQATAKGWVRSARGGARLPILPGVPEPGARGTAAQPAPAVVKRGPGRPRKAA